MIHCACTKRLGIRKASFPNSLNKRKQRIFITYQTTVQQLLHATKMRRGFGLLLLQKPRFITTKILIYVVPTPFFMETLTHLRTAECKGIKHENRLVYLPGYLLLFTIVTISRYLAIFACLTV